MADDVFGNPAIAQLLSIQTPQGQTGWPGMEAMPVGAMSGYYQGEQAGSAAINQNYQEQAADLANQSAQLQLQEQQKNVPLMAQERGLMSDKINALRQSMYGPDALQQQLLKSGAKTQLAADLAKQSSDQLLETVGKYGMMHMAYTQASDPKFDWNDPDNVDMLKSMIRKAGGTVRDGPLDPKATLAKLEALSHASVMDPGTLRQYFLDSKKVAATHQAAVGKGNEDLGEITLSKSFDLAAISRQYQLGLQQSFASMEPLKQAQLLAKQELDSTHQLSVPTIGRLFGAELREEQTKNDKFYESSRTALFQNIRGLGEKEWAAAVKDAEPMLVAKGFKNPTSPANYKNPQIIDALVAEGIKQKQADQALAMIKYNYGGAPIGGPGVPPGKTVDDLDLRSLKQLITQADPSSGFSIGNVGNFQSPATDAANAVISRVTGQQPQGQPQVQPQPQTTVAPPAATHPTPTYEHPKDPSLEWRWNTQTGRWQSRPKQTQ